jgi:hypothetical protein
MNRIGQRVMEGNVRLLFNVKFSEQFFANEEQFFLFHLACSDEQLFE